MKTSEMETTRQADKNFIYCSSKQIILTEPSEAKVMSESR